VHLAPDLRPARPVRTHGLPEVPEEPPDRAGHRHRLGIGAGHAGSYGAQGAALPPASAVRNALLRSRNGCSDGSISSTGTADPVARRSDPLAPGEAVSVTLLAGGPSISNHRT